MLQCGSVKPETWLRMPCMPAEQQYHGEETGFLQVRNRSGYPEALQQNHVTDRRSDGVGRNDDCRTGAAFQESLHQLPVCRSEVIQNQDPAPVRKFGLQRQPRVRPGGQADSQGSCHKAGQPVWFTRISGVHLKQPTRELSAIAGIAGSLQGKGSLADAGRTGNRDEPGAGFQQPGNLQQFRVPAEQGLAAAGRTAGCAGAGRTRQGRG